MNSRHNKPNYTTSRDYELLVRNLIEQEMSGISGVELIEILHNVKMKGLSGYHHQIDVAFRFRIWETEMLVIVECKQYRKSVGVDDLLEFRSRIEDLRAHKGIFVTSSGFQSGAIEFAEANRIALMIVRGTMHLGIHHNPFPTSPEERCEWQLEELRNEYKVASAETESRIFIDHTEHTVIVTHDGVRVIIKPGELKYDLLYQMECQFEARDSERVFFSGSRLPYLPVNKVLKSIILDGLLVPHSDG